MTNINAGINVRIFCIEFSKRAGGSGLCVSMRLKCRQLQQNKINCEGCENVWVEIISKIPALVGSVYGHSFSILSEFEETHCHVQQF